MNYLAYRRSLSACFGKPATLENITSITPHLTIDERRIICNNSDYVRFSVPPCRVDDVAHKITVYEGEISSKLVKARDEDNSYAIDYAKKHWPEQLCQNDKADSCMENILQDTRVVGDVYPKTVCAIWCILDKDAEISDRDNLDDHIIECTSEEVIADELRYNKGVFMVWSCSRCGGSLGNNSCAGCGRVFRDDVSHSGLGIPITEKMRKCAMDAGNIFENTARN